MDAQVDLVAEPVPGQLPEVRDLLERQFRIQVMDTDRAIGVARDLAPLPVITLQVAAVAPEVRADLQTE